MVGHPGGERGCLSRAARAVALWGLAQLVGLYLPGVLKPLWATPNPGWIASALETLMGYPPGGDSPRSRDEVLGVGLY